MATSADNVSMALFCDFENVALGVRDAKYEKFDIKRVLERLLLKGSIVVKKAYCDWDRYKSFKAAMHEANFELIEIPHVRQSGKNSADIRLVVDALDLCYTKSHVDTFVIISGDSDFSPLVSKLRENAKQVIGVGVKQSTSDLLIANCDEFIFYDDLVRDSQRATSRKETREAHPSGRRSPEEERRRRDEVEARRTQAIEIAVETFDALLSERGDSGKIWASVLKEAIKRRKPDFSESYYGFRAFGNLLEEARARGLLEFGRDEKSGTYVYRGSEGGRAEVVSDLRPAQPEPAVGAVATAETAAETLTPAAAGSESSPSAMSPAESAPQIAAPKKTRRKSEATRKKAQPPEVEAVPSEPFVASVTEEQPAAVQIAVDAREGEPERKPASRGRRPRKSESVSEAVAEAPVEAVEGDATPRRKAAPRSRRPRKKEPAADDA